MEKQIDTRRKFSILQRAKSFNHAFHGFSLFLKTTHNAWIQMIIFLCVVVLGIYFKITSIEWAILILTGGVVLASEAFNTAIEIDINLTSPEYHPYAKNTKDVAAGAVLILSITAIIIGIIVFWPYIKI